VSEQILNGTSAYIGYTDYSAIHVTYSDSLTD